MMDTLGVEAVAPFTGGSALMPTIEAAARCGVISASSLKIMANIKEEEEEEEKASQGGSLEPSVDELLSGWVLSKVFGEVIKTLERSQSLSSWSPFD